MPLDALVALVASRSGVHPVVYLHTRTDRVFAADVNAWICSWSVPARMLMGGGKGGKGSGRPTPGGGGDNGGRDLSWLRERRNSQGRAFDRRKVIDMDRLDPPGDPRLIEGAKRREVAPTGQIAAGLADAFRRRKAWRRDKREGARG